MLDAVRDIVRPERPTQQTSNARQQERRVHGAVLPVLQVALIEAPILGVQPPATHAPPQHAAPCHVTDTFPQTLLLHTHPLAVLVRAANCDGTHTRGHVDTLAATSPLLVLQQCPAILHTAKPKDAAGLCTCLQLGDHVPIRLVASPQLCIDAHQGEQHHEQRL